MAGLESAAATALAEVSTATTQVTQQVQRTADAAQCLVSQAKTGQNPIFKINPPGENNPAGYLEDDESIARGAAKWVVRILSLINGSLNDVRDNAAKAVVDSQIDPNFLTPGVAPLNKRYGRLMADLSKVGAALNLQKDQGHKLNKSAEMLMNLAKGFYNQAGSMIYNEAPMMINAARMITNRASSILDEADDLYTRTQSQIHRTNVYVMVAQQLIEISGTGGRTLVTKGELKAITAVGKSILLQSGKDLMLYAKDNLKASGKTLQMDATAGDATLQATGNVNVKGAMVFLGSSGVINAPAEDTITPVTINDLLEDKADKKPGLLVETALGRTPAGVSPPRTSPDEVVNRE